MKKVLLVLCFFSFYFVFSQESTNVKINWDSTADYKLDEITLKFPQFNQENYNLDFSNKHIQFRKIIPVTLNSSLRILNVNFETQTIQSVL